LRSLLGFSCCFFSYWQPNFPSVSGSYLPGFSGCICRYWQPNFPPVSVFTCWDFLALPFPARECKKSPSKDQKAGIFRHICFFWPGFSDRSFSGMGNFKKLYGRQVILFWYRQQDFLSLIREFSGRKLKQKGFFHSVISPPILLYCVCGPIVGIYKSLTDT
jgi:hypothetical protein